MILLLRAINTVKWNCSPFCYKLPLWNILSYESHIEWKNEERFESRERTRKKLEYFTEGENYDSLRRKHVPLLSYKAWSRKREKHHKKERKKTSEERLKSRKIEITFVPSIYEN